MLIFPPFFGLPIYGLFSAVYFGYVAIGRYVLSIVDTVVRSFDVMTACNSTFKQPSTVSNLQLCLQYFWPSSPLSRSRRPRAPSQVTVFCAGPFGGVAIAGFLRSPAGLADVPGLS